MENRRLPWIDALRVLACFGVVWLHSGAILMDNFEALSDFDWWVCNIYFNSVRCRIPLFLMISGAVILPRVYDGLGVYLRRRVLRLVWPFVFWTLVYIPLRFYLLQRAGNPDGVTPAGFVFTGFRDGVTLYYWYIYMIVGLNLFFPILGGWIRAASEVEIRYFLIVWLVTVFAALPWVEPWMPRVDLRYFAGYIGYPVLGYWLRTRDFGPRRRVALWAGAVVAVCGVVSVVVTHLMSVAHGRLWGGVTGNLSPLVVVMGAALFLLFKNLDWERAGAAFARAVRFLGRYSYGVYLVHAIVFTVIWHFGIYHSMIHPALGIPVTAVTCFAVSVAAVWVVNKVPRIGKYISG